jgi:FAD/FMN-containing dehydrogenase
MASDGDDGDRFAITVTELPGKQDVAVAIDPGPMAALWRYREDITAAINTLGPPHKLDVTVPPADLAGFIDDIPGRVAAVDPAARTWLFGHVGDGNIHVNVTGVDPADERVDEVVIDAVAEVGGSISAEHGIGTAKVRWLHHTRSNGEIAAMRAIKSALDPAGICNPNVLLPPG